MAPKINIKNTGNIRLFRIYSVPIRISSADLHVSDTCFLREINFMGRYVTITYRLHELHVCTKWIRIYYVSYI